MKRLLFGSLVALGFVVTAAPAWADCCFDYSCCRHLSWTHTRRNRCISIHSYCNPLPCAPSCGYGAPTPWNSLYAYGPHGYAVAAQPAPVAVAPAAAAPASSTPQFRAPQPAPASNGVKQAVYSYGQTPTPGYSYNPGYNYYGTSTGYDYYGYGAGYSYAQAPNYWY